jgi:hypothetical protein
MEKVKIKSWNMLGLKSLFLKWFQYKSCAGNSFYTTNKYLLVCVSISPQEWMDDSICSFVHLALGKKNKNNAIA